MPLPEGQAAACDALERGGNSLEGAFGSQSRRGFARGGGGRPALERGGLLLEGLPTLERDGSPLEGAIDPRARRICTEAVPYPSSGVKFCPRVAGPIV
jgi:hypothetical protein